MSAPVLSSYWVITQSGGLAVEIIKGTDPNSDEVLHTIDLSSEALNKAFYEEIPPFSNLKKIDPDVVDDWYELANHYKNLSAHILDRLNHLSDRGHGYP